MNRTSGLRFLSTCKAVWGTCTACHRLLPNIHGIAIHPLNMLQALASNSVGQSPRTDSHKFKVILEVALDAYNKKTKQSLQGHALLTQLESCDSSTAILNLLRGQVKPDTDEGLKKWLNPTINVLYAFSATLGEGVGLVNIDQYGRWSCPDTDTADVLTRKKLYLRALASSSW
jgi:hypothetical protein